MRALILVDLQNDFMPGGALAVADGDAVVPVANRVMPLFSRVIATQDAHPPEHGSFVTQHPTRRVGDTVTLAGLPQTVWPVHCVAGSHGAAFHDALDISRIERVFPKGTDAGIDSYSGFFDNGKRKATGLGAYLAESGVDEVYVMGLATDYCVKATALDALGLGFRTYLVVDGCRAVNLSPEDGARAVAEMRDAGVVIVESSQLEHGSPEAARELVRFWTDAGPAKWFAKDDAFDAAFHARFLKQHELAARGELDAWLETPDGALALLLLLDQFPRNSFRGTPRMFATDSAARAAAERAVRAGHDRKVPDALRVFFYLPFEHSEELTDQERSVQLHADLPDVLRWAEEHRDIIRRFGRFPHRNALLGRVSTDEERAFLASGGFSG